MFTRLHRSTPGPTTFIIVCLCLLSTTRADEAVLPNGQRVRGELTSDGQGRLLFQSFGQQLPLPLARLHHVCFPLQRLAPLRAGAPFQVVLCDDQHLTGELLELGKEQVKLRTVWREALTIPRSAAAAVKQAPGFVTIVLDDFEKDLKSWRVKGVPRLSPARHVSGRQSLCFAGPGQAEYTLAAPLAAGRAGISFCAGSRTTRLPCQIEAEFAASAGWSIVRVLSDPQGGGYTAEVSGTAASNARLPRKEGWQRLELEFGQDQLVLSIDDAVLLSCRQPGSGGALRKIRLACIGLPPGTSGGSEVYFDDFSLARAVPELKHPEGDSEQDEVWLVSGDQLFGKVVDATENKIHLHALFGLRTLPWSDVRGVYFRLSNPVTRKREQESVRVWLQPGTGLEPDILDGSVVLFDNRRLVLRHEVLGELEIDRKRLHRLQPLSR